MPKNKHVQKRQMQTVVAFPSRMKKKTNFENNPGRALIGPNILNWLRRPIKKNWSNAAKRSEDQKQLMQGNQREFIKSSKGTEK